MTKIFRLTFLLWILFLPAFGQSQQLILTTAQNEKWLDSLQKLPFDQQLSTIKARLLFDTNVFVKQSYPDRIRVADSLGKRVYGDGKPMLVIGGYPVNIDNDAETNSITRLTTLLTPHYIKSVFILHPNDPAATALYGAAGQFGIIILSVTKNKYRKLFKR